MQISSYDTSRLMPTRIAQTLFEDVPFKKISEKPKNFSSFPAYLLMLDTFRYNRWTRYSSKRLIFSIFIFL